MTTDGPEQSSQGWEWDGNVRRGTKAMVELGLGKGAGDGGRRSRKNQWGVGLYKPGAVVWHV